MFQLSSSKTLIHSSILPLMKIPKMPPKISERNNLFVKEQTRKKRPGGHCFASVLHPERNLEKQM